MTVAGVGLIAFALATNQRWLDRHFLPSFFLPRQWYVVLQTLGRTLIGAAGLALILWRRRLSRGTAGDLSRMIPIVAAAVLALVAGEVVLRYVHVRPTEWLRAEEEPQRQPDPKLGWVLAPARTGHASVGGRAIDYAVDTSGYRVRRVEEPVDRTMPTLVFAGESVMFGEGLQWDETIPAQTGAMLRVQSANLAVHGYSTDQTYLRLAAELPRFERPVAVVALFMTALFGRNLDDDRPHLGPGLEPLPAVPRSRLTSLAELIVPFRRDDTVDRGVTMTRQALGAIVALARAHRATPLVIVPQFGREASPEEAIRRRIFDGSGVPVLTIELDANWRLPWDRHPNADAAKKIAAAIADRLRPRI